MITAARAYASINGRVLTKIGLVFTLSKIKNVYRHDKLIRGFNRNETIG